MSKISDLLTKEQKAAKEWVEKTKEDLSLKRLLNKAHSHESKKEYREAIDAYFKFLELKLKVLKERPQHTLKDYLELIPYYEKIAQCYKKTKHLKPEDRIEDMEKAAQYYEKAAEMSLEQKNYKKAHSYYEQASQTFQEIEEYDNAALCYVKIAQMYRKKESLLISSSAYTKAGKLYEQGENFKDAGEVYKKAAQLNVQVKNPREAITNYEKAGDCYRKLKKYKEGIKFYLEGCNLSSDLEHYHEAAQLYGKVGLSYEKFKDYQNGIYYYLKSAQLGGEEVKKSSYGGAGRCYESLHSFQKAIQYYKKAAHLSSELDQTLEEALFHKDIARCYENLGEKEKAANFYFQYADLGKEEDPESKEGYQTASKIYLETAHKYLPQHEEKAIQNYEKAAEAYQDSGEDKKAAEIFQEIAEINLKKNNYKEAIKAYSQAGELYQKVDDSEKAALAYYRAENYQEAVNIYVNAASRKEKQDNLFLAGEQYQKAARCYQKMKEEEEAGSHYAKAIHAYRKHLDQLKYKSLGKEAPGNEGETYRKLGESQLLRNKMPQAEKDLQKALDYFKENELERETLLTKGLLLRVKADLAVRQGDYENASQFLTESISLLEESLKEEAFTREYKNFLQKNKSQAQEILQDISQKPEVTLLLDRHSYTFINTPVVVNAYLENQVDQEVEELNFLAHLPHKLEVTLLPSSIPKLKGGQSQRKSLEILPKKVGEFRLRPLEVYYKDKQGNKYVKASNKVTLKVVEKPSMDYKDYRITVSTFEKYAQTQLKNKNFFHAGEGFWGIAQTYGRFNEDIAAKENYQKAIKYYQKYAHSLTQEQELGTAQLHSLGDTYQKIGQSYEKVKSLKDSAQAYQKSLNYYEKTKQKAGHEQKVRLQYQIMNTQAFLSKVKGKYNIKHGDYQKAHQLLQNSLQLLEESVKKGDYTQEEEKFLEKNQRECQALIQDIKQKPQLYLKLDYETQAHQNKSSTINIKIQNKWDKPLTNLKFLLSLPPEFKLKEEPSPITSIKPQESQPAQLQIIPQKEGDYTFKPFDLTYRDPQGNNYMKGCEEVHFMVKQ